MSRPRLHGDVRVVDLIANAKVVPVGLAPKRWTKWLSDAKRVGFYDASTDRPAHGVEAGELEYSRG